jgi:hypothetical protein
VPFLTKAKIQRCRRAGGWDLTRTRARRERVEAMTKRNFERRNLPAGLIFSSGFMKEIVNLSDTALARLIASTGGLVKAKLSQNFVWNCNPYLRIHYE